MNVAKLRRMRELETLIVEDRNQLKKDTNEYLSLFEEWHEEKGGKGDAKAVAYLRIHYRKNSSILGPLGDIIRKARKKRKLTITQAAKLAGVAFATMYKYESGELKPKMERVVSVYPELEGAKEWKLLELV